MTKQKKNAPERNDLKKNRTPADKKVEAQEPEINSKTEGDDYGGLTARDLKKNLGRG